MELRNPVQRSQPLKAVSALRSVASRTLLLLEIKPESTAPPGALLAIKGAFLYDGGRLLLLEVAMAGCFTMLRLVLLLWLVLVLSACSVFGSSDPPYLVYFQQRSAQLDPPARTLIALAARRAGEEPAAPVDIVGFTNSAGSPPADLLLSQQRAQSVADALVANGVAAGRLVRIGRGQTGGDPGIASRRVEITIGG
jgi:hypothetical protein